MNGESEDRQPDPYGPCLAIELRRPDIASLERFVRLLIEVGCVQKDRIETTARGLIAIMPMRLVNAPSAEDE